MSAIAMVERTATGTPVERDCAPTLDRLIAGTWNKLAAHDPVDCPVCEAPMAPIYGVHALPVGGRCTECATELR